MVKKIYIEVVMKGVERKIDNLGRIVIPSNYRNILGLRSDDKLQIFMDNGNIILSPVKHLCVICGTALKEKSDMNICKKCINVIKENENG